MAVAHSSVRLQSSPARPPGRRSEAEAARTRERVVRHAERLFARKGFAATSLREIAGLSGVRMFTIQHHFGSKAGLYQEILRRWDRDVEDLVRRVLGETHDPREAVERVIPELFAFFVANRARVAVSARAALGEGLPRQVSRADHGWVRFMSTMMTTHRLAAPGMDLGLLLVTLEGILHNHALAVAHYRDLFGRDVSDPGIAARTKTHVTRVILSLVGPIGASQ